MSPVLRVAACGSFHVAMAKPMPDPHRCELFLLLRRLAMDDRNLHLSEKFARLVIDTVLREHGTELYDRLVRDVVAATSQQLAELREELKALKNSLPATPDATTQKLLKSLESKIMAPSGDAERREQWQQQVVDVIRELQREVKQLHAQRYDESRDFDQARREHLAHQESRSKYDRTMDRAATPSKAPAASADDDESEATRLTPDRVAADAEPAPRGKWLSRMQPASYLSFAAAIFLALLALLVIKWPATERDVAVRAAPRPAAAPAQERRDPDQIIPESTPSPVAPVPSRADEYVAHLVGVLQKRLEASQWQSLASKLKNAGADVQDDKLHTPLTMRLLAEATRGEDKQVAALFLQAVVADKGQQQNYKPDGILGEGTKRSLLQISCVAKTVSSNPSTADLAGQLEAIINACAK
jgi:hypothetical protein